MSEQPPLQQLGDCIRVVRGTQEALTGVAMQMAISSDALEREGEREAMSQYGPSPLLLYSEPRCTPRRVFDHKYHIDA